jgi:hypothetical protein
MIAPIDDQAFVRLEHRLKPGLSSSVLCRSPVSVRVLVLIALFFHPEIFFKVVTDIAVQTGPAPFRVNLSDLDSSETSLVQQQCPPGAQHPCFPLPSPREYLNIPIYPRVHRSERSNYSGRVLPFLSTIEVTV